MNMVAANFGHGGYLAIVPIEDWGDDALLWVDDVCSWCRRQFGKERRRWKRHDSYSVQIFSDEDAMLFKLAWVR